MVNSAVVAMVQPILSGILYLGLMILMPIEARADIPVVVSEISSNQAWQRQQIIISVKVQTDDPFARLQVDDFKQKNFSVQPFSSSPSTLEGKETKLYTLKKEWVLFPLQAGDYRLQLPRIRYRPSRGSIKTLVSPSLELAVKQLPIYVPPTMPVGRIDLKSHWEEGRIVTTKKLLQWQIEVQGEGVFQQTLPAVSRKLRSNDSLEILPIQRSEELVEHAKGVTHNATYTIPVKSLQSGRLKFPAISVQYFDPQLGKLQKVQLDTPLVFALNKWLQWIIGLVLIATFLTGLLMLSQKIKVYLYKLIEKRKALRLLEQATSYQQIRTALNQLSTVQKMGTNLTLSKFVTVWKQRNGKNTEFEKAVEALSAYEFGRSERKDMTSIAKRLAQVL